MHISKYFELLRFYITEKIDKVDKSLKNTVSGEVRTIVSSLLSALFSLFISTEFINENGILWALLKIAIVIVSFFVFYFLFSQLSRHFLTIKEIKKSDNKELTDSQREIIIDKFDHIGCDGVLLARDFLNKYKNDSLTVNEQHFALIEAFYYCKKSIDVTTTIIDYSKLCVNSENNRTGISLYRLINVYKMLEELHKEINDNITMCDIAKKDELISEINEYSTRITEIGEFVSPYTDTESKETK